MVLLLLASLVAIALSTSNHVALVNVNSQLQLCQSISGEMQMQINTLNSQLREVVSSLSYTDSKVNALQHSEPSPRCGPGLWQRVAFLNMSDPSEQCPSAWREYSGVRVCGRP